MLNSFLAIYLLIIAPSLNMWRSLRQKNDKVPRAPMLRYWSMSWQSLVMLGVLLAGSWQAGYTVRDIGFDIPLSNAGAWGLCFSVLLLGGLSIAGLIIERRYTAEDLAHNERKLLDSPFPWPRTGVETVAFVVSMTLMTAGWEILYRGFILLFLTPSVGLPIAVAVSAFAYGIGHGYQSPKQLLASIVSAFVFTIAYASTNSLWWLIVIHAGLPLGAVPAALRAYRRSKIETLNTAT